MLLPGVSQSAERAVGASLAGRCRSVSTRLAAPLARPLLLLLARSSSSHGRRRRAARAAAARGAALAATAGQGGVRRGSQHGPHRDPHI